VRNSPNVDFVLMVLVGGCKLGGKSELKRSKRIGGDGAFIEQQAANVDSKAAKKALA